MILFFLLIVLAIIPLTFLIMLAWPMLSTTPRPSFGDAFRFGAMAFFAICLLGLIVLVICLPKP